MMNKLTNKVALVVGAGSGIGRAIAELYQAEGANVALADLNEDSCTETIRGDSSTYRVDVTSSESVKAWVQAVIARYGRIDVLVNSVGILNECSILEMSPETFDNMLAVNLRGIFLTCRYVAPHMVEQKAGRIINIASAHGLTASPYKSAYVSAKHGLVGLTKTIALELAEVGGTCNAICPGYVLTPLVEGQIPDQMKAHNMSREDVIKNVMLDRQPTKEFVTVEQMGTFAVFLASDMGAQITGAALPADGGWTAM